MSTDLRLTTLLLLVFSFALPLQALELEDFNGKSASIEEYTGKGKWLVVMIWAHDCHVCNQEASNYDFFHDAYKDKTASVLGISIDGVANKAKAQAFITRHNLSFPNLIGNSFEFKQMFNEISADFAQAGWQAMPTPGFLIYNPKGKLVVQEIGAVPVTLIEAYIERNSNAAGNQG
ncbi:MAG: TlpA family protein disulfide reductase [Gammaproteobacteria bacterium]|nr:TlpA family protein disulfide reductase [Gammaproteobacteria bacterium]